MKRSSKPGRRWKRLGSPSDHVEHPAPGGGGEIHHKDASKKITSSRGCGSGKENMKQEKYKTFDELPLMLSVPEVASVLGISRAGAYELVKEKGFPSLTIGSRILVPRDKLIAWIDEKSSGSAE